eukprot:1972344-Prorocentrum_lima.AAC.1
MCIRDSDQGTYFRKCAEGLKSVPVTSKEVASSKAENPNIMERKHPEGAGELRSLLGMMLSMTTGRNETLTTVSYTHLRAHETRRHL